MPDTWRIGLNKIRYPVVGLTETWACHWREFGGEWGPRSQVGYSEVGPTLDRALKSLADYGSDAVICMDTTCRCRGTGKMKVEEGLFLFRIIVWIGVIDSGGDHRKGKSIFSIYRFFFINIFKF